MRLILLLTFLAPFMGAAQSSRILYDKAPVWAIKWSPLHLVNYYPTFQLGVERRIRGMFTVQLDGGLVVSGWGTDDLYDGAHDKHGYKLKGDLRYYFFKSKGLRLLMYGAPELYYNHVDYKNTATYGKDCDAQGACNFRQQEALDMQYRERGVNLKYGIMHRFPSGICLDYHVGISYRSIHYAKLTVPDGILYNHEDYGLDFSPDEQSKNIVRPTTGFRVGYILK